MLSPAELAELINLDLQQTVENMELDSEKYRVLLRTKPTSKDRDKWIKKLETIERTLPKFRDVVCRRETASG